MDTILYWVARGFIAGLQALPLELVARLGRCGGGLAYYLDGRHRRVAQQKLAASFPGKSGGEIRALTRENFRNIGEGYACGVKTAGMPWHQLVHRLEFDRPEKFLTHFQDGRPQSRVVAVGHFGNFELYARFGQVAPIFRCATTYRGLPQPSLNQLLQSLRQRSGCLFFERRTDGAALKMAFQETGFMLGLLADQSVGAHGVKLKFLGRDCSCSVAPAVLALRYHCRLHTAVCYRIGLARWRIDIGDEIWLTQDEGVPRSVENITRDINSAFEAAIGRDPANWFWVHNRWKSGSVVRRQAKPGIHPSS